MGTEQDAPTGTTRLDGQPTKGRPHRHGGSLAMPTDDDPAGDGHMFSPGPDWPPARPDAAGGEGDTANDASEPPAEDAPRS